ncbi:NADH-ubiquinone oxidoreductase-F iron-sulfur binding region domain-containing protein [Humibacter ginsengiterrae]
MSATSASRLFAAGPRASYRAHLETYGPIDTGGSPAALLGEIERSGLTGRGGAGFATWRKMQATDAARASRMIRNRPIVIANGAEGEPLSLKDKTLLENAPHLVIDGLLASAAALHAYQAYIYVAAGILERLGGALNERPDHRRITLAEAPDTFISGEASAVVNSIGTGNAVPQDRVRRLSEAGLKGRPTLVHNVETLAHIALVARYGGAWFRSVGSHRDPGTRLVTITGRVPTERVMEVPGDSVLSGILRAGGADLMGVRAVLVGGFHGTWVPRDALDAPLSIEGLAPLGASPGAGLLSVLGTGECGLRTTARIVDYLAEQSARQCGPCMFGLPELARMLAELANGTRRQKLPARLRALAGDITGRGSCHHPDGTARLVSSALSVFRDDVHAHLSGRCLSSRRR